MGKDTPIQSSKRLIAITIGPSGELRTERGGTPLGHLGPDSTLDGILSNENTQRILREKLNGTGGSERDPRLGIIQGI